MPAPIKHYTRYFTIPITQSIYEGLEKLKYRMQLDKTEFSRRIIEYFLALPADSQEKILKSFNQMREQQAKEIRARHPRNVRKRQALQEQVDLKRKLLEERDELLNKPKPSTPKPAAPFVRPLRSGLP